MSRGASDRTPTELSTRSVIVVGGGLVGLSCAYYLRLGGAEVTVIERERVGSGASRGNAGLVCPSMADPLPSPGIVREAAMSLLRSDSAFFVRARSLPRMAPFLVRFARRSTRTIYEQGLHALAPLARATFERYDELALDGIDVGEGREGYIIACASERSAREAREQMLRMGELGLASAPGPVLDGAGLQEIEPALGEGAAAGFIQPDERWVDPSRLIDGLEAHLRQAGVEVVEHAEVRGIRESARTVTVDADGRGFKAKAAVIAGGIRSEALCRSLGLPLGMRPGKGYSFSVHPEPMPARPFYLVDGHAAITPMGDWLRIAGTMEFDGTLDRFNPRRIDAIEAAARPYVRGVDWSLRADEWVGPRPMTPDGLPSIGRVPGRRRIYVAAGHNMLGVTLAPATGKVVADLLLSGDPGIDLAHFAPGRFGPRRRRLAG